PDGLYRWGVEVYQAGVITGWSNESYFSVDTVPALVGNINVSATANSATISWKTDKASTTLLEFGMNNEFGSTVKDMNVTTDHSVTIFGLSPITKYCFRIKSVGINGIENIFPASEFITRPEITPALEYTKIPGEKVSLLKNTQITINVLHSTVSKLVLISSEDLYDVKFFIEDSAIPIDPSYVQLFQYDIKISPKVVGSIEFKIETERIRMYNIEEVYVLHYANGSWNRLNTCFIKSDGPYCYFSAYTDSFSPFAIVGTIAERPFLEKNVPTTFPHVEDSDEDIAWMMTTIGGLGAIIILTMVLLKPYILRMEKRTHNRSANPKRKDKI
ncbi:MAG: PGF-pre-PGF domain-containing protein, partial [Candidatus Hadarchaeaceae archaeon]